MKFLSLLLIVFIQSAYAQIQTGKASFYADSFEGSPTASGEKYHANQFTAAHKILPFGTIVRVTNLTNKQSVEVTINDRGPFVEGRVIDLSKAAAEKIGMLNKGVADVKIEVVDPGNGKGKSQPVMVDRVTVDEKEFYDFKINKIEPKGFGAQVGTYQELVNVFHISETLKSKYKKKIVVQVKVVNGVKYYSLILGPFSSRSKAETLVDDLKKQFPDSFVFDYSKN
ncbi:MAG: Septum-associated rare lipoprotein A [Cytophagales bacterium]|jgi:rare lipoprotein A|nr:septal ring lytic transglycosylase RlpA family protein [Bacteroidota bacterium]MBS1979786.1 septal ring lytic transglycosylase RlpA family protein [Bacteroidota bacterium]WHZ07041.1 MAG: Septum-associated rare lipoprotein A [Cytophagales bacterium]